MPIAYQTSTLRGTRAELRIARERANATLGTEILLDARRRDIAALYQRRDLTFPEALAQLRTLRMLRFVDD
jgi:hypothetical protein